MGNDIGIIPHGSLRHGILERLKEFFGLVLGVDFDVMFGEFAILITTAQVNNAERAVGVVVRHESPFLQVATVSSNFSGVVGTT